MITGYTTGVFDLFHIGHLNILKNAKSVCDRLIVGVTTDEFCLEYKNYKPLIPFEQRYQIVDSIKYVDLTVTQLNHNKIKAWEKHKFDIMIVGDDWKNTDKWNQYEHQFMKYNVEIKYFKRTKDVSSSDLRKDVKNHKIKR